MEDDSVSALPYPHTTITKDQFRLFQLSKSRHGTIKVKLQAFRLAAQHPPFNAVSYVCGRGLHKDPITVNDHPFRILENLWPFLQLICTHSELAASSSWWWIDSICINQGDIRERSAQISSMGAIYAKAESTIIWLGPETPDTSQALPFLHQLHQLGPRSDRELDLIAEFRAQRSQWMAVQNVFLGPWWKRVWTVQELCLSRNAIFYCGRQSIRAKHWKPALYAAWLCCCFEGGLVSREAWNAAWSRRRIAKFHEELTRMTLVSLMAYLGDNRATEPKDRIFSLLGLIPSSDREMVSRLDYESAEDVIFSRLVRCFIEKHKSLDIICYAQIFNRRPERVVGSSPLASWVPDWRVPVPPLAVPLMVSQGSQQHIDNFRPADWDKSPAVYQASGMWLPDVTVDPDGREIICSGICLANVGMVGAGPDAAPGQSQAPSSTEPMQGKSIEEAFGLLSIIARCVTLDRRDRYLCHTAPARYCSDFLAACLAAQLWPSEVNEVFLTWYRAHQSFQVRAGTLENLVSTLRPSVSPENYSLAKALRAITEQFHVGSFEDPGLADLSDYNTFIAQFYNTIVNLRRRLIKTTSGLLGMAPPSARPGDTVCMLFGCSVPVILRPLVTAAQETKYEFVGECYLHGYMNGEAIVQMEYGRLKRERYCLI